MERGRAKARVGSGGVGWDEAVRGGVSYLYRRAVQGGERDEMGRDGAGWGGIGRDEAVRCGAVRYDIVLCGTVRCGTVRCGAVCYGAVRGRVGQDRAG